MTIIPNGNPWLMKLHPNIMFKNGVNCFGMQAIKCMVDPGVTLHIKTTLYFIQSAYEHGYVDKVCISDVRMAKPKAETCLNEFKGGETNPQFIIGNSVNKSDQALVH